MILQVSSIAAMSAISDLSLQLCTLFKAGTLFASCQGLWAKGGLLWLLLESLGTGQERRGFQALKYNGVCDIQVSPGFPWGSGLSLSLNSYLVFMDLIGHEGGPNGQLLTLLLTARGPMGPERWNYGLWCIRTELGTGWGPSATSLWKEYWFGNGIFLVCLLWYWELNSGTLYHWGISVIIGNSAYL